MTNSTFDDFWSICPRKVGKKAAEKEYWKARKDVAHEVLCNAMQRYADYHKARGTAMEFIAHPRTWLYQGRWEDDTPEPNRVADSNTTRPCPRYLRPREDDRPKETPEEKARKQLRLDVHEVMRARQLNPLVLRIEDKARYDAEFRQIAAMLQGRQPQPSSTAGATNGYREADSRIAGGGGG